MRKTSCKKLDVTQVFSILDTEFEQWSNNQNDQLYRSESGEITWWKKQVRTNLNYDTQLKKLVGQITEKYIEIT